MQFLLLPITVAFYCILPLNKSLLHFLRRDSLVSPLTSWPQIPPEIIITIPFEKSLTFDPYELN